MNELFSPDLPLEVWGIIFHKTELVPKTPGEFLFFNVEQTKSYFADYGEGVKGLGVILDKFLFDLNLFRYICASNTERKYCPSR
jgi:hypothetical protein